MGDILLYLFEKKSFFIDLFLKFLFFWVKNSL